MCHVRDISLPWLESNLQHSAECAAMLHKYRITGENESCQCPHVINMTSTHSTGPQTERITEDECLISKSLKLRPTNVGTKQTPAHSLVIKLVQNTVILGASSAGNNQCNDISSNHMLRNVRSCIARTIDLVFESPCSRIQPVLQCEF